MLWLEKLAGEKQQTQKPKPSKEEPEADWLAELEKEVTEDDKNSENSEDGKVQDDDGNIRQIHFYFLPN